jgi:hypothetical protein
MSSLVNNTATITIREVSDTNHWDNDLELFEGSIFISRPWLNCITDENIKPVFLEFYNEHNRVGLLAGVDAPVRNHFSRQLFFYSGIALAKEGNLQIQSCKKALVAYAKKKKFSRITLKSYDHQGTKHPSLAEFNSYDRMEYIFDLRNGSQKVTDQFDPDFRRRVRKAEKSGLIFRKSFSPELIDTLFKLQNETLHTRKSKGYGNYSFLFLPYFDRVQIRKLLESRTACFFYAELDQKILSIQYNFNYKNRTYGIFMGSEREGYRLGAPSFLFQKAVEDLATNGCKFFNLGGVQRSKSHAGLKKFKDSMHPGIFHSTEETTNFIGFPLKIYNPVMNLKNMLENAPIIPWRLRKPIIRVSEWILKGRNKY